MRMILVALSIISACSLANADNGRIATVASADGVPIEDPPRSNKPLESVVKELTR
jgi:hypothetical protein